MFHFTDYFNIFLPGLFIDSHLLVSKRSNFINNQPSTSTNPSYHRAFWPKHTTELYFQTVFFTQRCRRNLSFMKYNTSNTNLNRQLQHERMETTITLFKIIQAFVYTHTHILPEGDHIPYGRRPRLQCVHWKQNEDIQMVWGLA